jgi:hypothetical protein
VNKFGFQFMINRGENKPILDFPDREPEKKSYTILGYGSLLILAVGLIGQWMHYPYWRLALLLGMAGMTIRSVLLFTLKPRRLFAWFYFIGRMALFVGAALYFSGLLRNPKIFYPAFGLFFIGVVLVTFDKKAKDNEQDEDDL